MAKQETIGIVLGEGSLEWSALRERQPGRVELTGHDRVELIAREPEAEAAAEAPADNLKDVCRGLKGLLVVGLSTEKALIRTADLPSTDVDEIAGMVELQVDKFSPFPSDQMAVSWEVLSQEEETSRVLMAAVPRRHVDELGHRFEAAGRILHGIDVEVLAWLHLLRQVDALVKEGWHLLLIMHAGHVELIMLLNGQPVIFRSLGGHEHSKPEDAAKEIAEETEYTLTVLEADWGTPGSMRGSIWSREETASELVTYLQRETGLTFEMGALESLAPLSEGIARRALRAQTPCINLVPRQWLETAQSRVLKKRLLKSSVVILGVWSLLVAGFLGALKWQTSRVGRLDARVQALQGPAADVRRMIDKVVELQERADRKYSGIECLREISSILPERVDLTSFVYKKAREVSLRGATEPGSVNLIYKFFEDLEASELFEQVSNQRVSTVGSGARRQAQFTVVGVLPSDEEEGQM